VCSWGGVVLASQDGKIVCDNTLDARVDISFRQKLPEVREEDIALSPLSFSALLCAGHGFSF
jgi:hypothetical protein